MAFYPPDTRPADSDAVRDYSVAVLGDLHYDSEPDTVYHSHYSNEGKEEWLWKVQRKEFARNGEMWRERCRDLVCANAEVARMRGVDFILQMGDVVQGDCDDPPTHKKMLGDAIAMLREQYGRALPFLTVVGNHDFRGIGAKEAYFEFADEFLAKELGFKVSYPAFAVRHGPDCWIFCDFETREMGKVTRLVESASWARHVFLVTHGPFTPAESPYWKWRLGGKCTDSAEYKALVDLVLARRVVVLSGHTHKIAHWRIENERGSYSELTVNSVWENKNQVTVEPMESSASEYGNYGVAVLRERGQEADVEPYLRDIAPFKRDLREFFFNNGIGHFILNVGEEMVSVDFYPGSSLTPARTFVMKKW